MPLGAARPGPHHLFGSAVEAVKARKTPVQSWFIDLSLMLGYWDGEGGTVLSPYRAGQCALWPARKPAPAVCRRPRGSVGAAPGTHDYLAERLEALGLAFVVEPGDRLPQLNAVWIPEGVEDAPSRRAAAGGITASRSAAGSVRLPAASGAIGLMGETCRPENVDRLAEALSVVLRGVASRPKYAVSG